MPRSKAVAGTDQGTPLSQKILQVMRMRSPKNVTPVKDVSLV